MQEQGKRLLLAVALALGVLLAWQWLFPPPKKPPPVPGKGSGSGAGAALIEPKAGMPTTLGTPDAVKRGDEQVITLTFPNAVVSFSSYGGALKSWLLTDKRYEHDKSGGTHLPPGELIPQQADAGAFQVNFANSTYALPTKTEWVGTKESDTKVRYTLQTDTFEIEKTFEVLPAAYLLRATIHVKLLKGDAHQWLAVSEYGFHDPKDSGGGGKSVQPRVWDSATLRGSEHLQTATKAVIEHPRFEYNIKWTGFEHPFMIAVIAPHPIAGTTFDKQTFADADGLMRTDIVYHPEMKPDSTVELVGFFGPKNYRELEAADGPAGFHAAFDDSIDLGWFGFIGSRLMWLLLKLYGLVGNWGVAIMVLTVIVKLLTIPFTTRSMRSMKAIAVLGPDLKVLQDKYKDDRQRLQMETMALYKQHGANPLSGCLPMFLQMPIWLALYRMLSSTGELYQQPFIRGWINDLTAADTTHVLPIALVVTMFLQARLQPTPQSDDPAQKMQQRMMQYGLPLMFGVMSFFFPAGLALYMFTNTCLTAVHSVYMNKFDKKSMELTAKLEAARAKAKAEKDGTSDKSKVAAAKAKANADDDAEDDDGDDAGKAIVKSGNKPGPRPNQNRSRGGKKKRPR